MKSSLVPMQRACSLRFLKTRVRLLTEQLSKLFFCGVACRAPRWPADRISWRLATVTAALQISSDTTHLAPPQPPRVCRTVLSQHFYYCFEELRAASGDIITGKHEPFKVHNGTHFWVAVRFSFSGKGCHVWNRILLVRVFPEKRHVQIKLTSLLWAEMRTAPFLTAATIAALCRMLVTDLYKQYWQQICFTKLPVVLGQPL